ncbi:hypothetical protein R3P38DRAFT_3221696 [Favolaschia claudopus]|uniref:RING-type domain-containing protein n=1 Tax=Favolaschia claudopus TaxID=2862362 RepID=A0AAW0A0Y9_9AGAR
MTSRAALYQTRLTGYFRIIKKSQHADTLEPRYLPFEGQQWFPIDVDSGTKESPIDVDWWTYVRENPEHSFGIKHGVTITDFRMWNLLGNIEFTGRVRLSFISFAMQANESGSTMCMHVFCGACLAKWLRRGATTCPICRGAINDQPIRDEAFEQELSEAIAVGLVAPPSAGGVKVLENGKGQVD